MHRVALCLVLALLGACSTAGKIGGIIAGTTPVVERDGDVCTVFNDTGGNPFEYDALRDDLATSCAVVRVGECNSSCTILMTMENACLIAGTRFGFHSTNLGGAYNYVLRQHYRAGILDRFDLVWSKSSEIQRITAEEAVTLDPQLQLCP